MARENHKEKVLYPYKSWADIARARRKNTIPNYKEKFNAYMYSFKFFLKQEEKVQSVNYCCEWCKKPNKPIYVRHLNFKNVFEENMEDLIVLCEDCLGNLKEIRELEKNYEKKKPTFTRITRKKRK